MPWPEWYQQKQRLLLHINNLEVHQRERQRKLRLLEKDIVNIDKHICLLQEELSQIEAAHPPRQRSKAK